jgi:TatD DNase family protein
MADLIDTHCHLTFDELADDVDGVLSRSVEAGVSRWVTVGTDPVHVRRAFELCKGSDGIWGGVGFHPHHADDVGEDEFAMLEGIVRDDKIVAVGEAGLDYHYNFSKQERQKEVFARLLDTAVRFEKPVIIHSRNAFEDTLDVLEGYIGKLCRGVVHCWSGSVEQTERLLEMGLFVSFTGIVTFKKSEETRKAARVVPLDRMMVETDCPFISPEPVRNQRPCEPGMMVHTARKIAEVKGVDFEEFAGEVTATSESFFGIRR